MEEFEVCHLFVCVALKRMHFLGAPDVCFENGFECGSRYVEVDFGIFGLVDKFGLSKILAKSTKGYNRNLSGLAKISTKNHVKR